MTNYHVISDASRLEVTLADHSSWKAVMVGAAPDRDLAVLQINAPAGKLRPIAIGESGNLLVGQKVFAIGNPFGLDQTLTTGVVSALGREIKAVTGRTIHDVIQTDAAINPGNSGGPLLDSAGRLIGVNTAIYSPSGASSGIGFAVPVGEVNRVVPQIISKGRMIRPGLGITLANQRLTQELGLDGVMILKVASGSSAAKAGLQGARQVREGLVRGISSWRSTASRSRITTVCAMNSSGTKSAIPSPDPVTRFGQCRGSGPAGGNELSALVRGWASCPVSAD